MAFRLCDLGIIHRDMGHLDQGEAYLRQALAVRQEILGARHVDTASALQELAVVVLVIPDAARLMKASEPDHRALGRLPADLEAFEVGFMIGQQVFAEDLEGVALQTEEDVGSDLHLLDISRIFIGAGGARTLAAAKDE